VPPEYDLTDPDAVSFCPSCGYGYTARATRCGRCDVALVPRAEIEASVQAAPTDTGLDPDGQGTVLLCRLDERVKANLLEAALERAGVPCWVRWAPRDPIDVIDMVGSRQLSEFRVPPRYLEEAQRILREIEEAP
jgi:hypothetical protein